MLSERANCKHLEFEVEGLPDFQFLPGQFVSMLAKNGEKQMTRAYSIASGPRGSNRFDLCLNRVENGFFSNHLCDLEQGHVVDFHGPHGHFVLKQPLRDSIFVATGTGIAPMRGFVEWLFPTPDNGSMTDRSEGKQIYLIYGTRHETEIYYRELFEEAARKHKNFHYTVTLSRADDTWAGARGYVQEHLAKLLDQRADHGKDSMDVYICGLNMMVSAVRKLLTEQYGWEKKQIVFERYD
jgi:ferredoxin-NADP reductase